MAEPASPRLSVVVPSHNGAATIGAAIASVPTRPDIEIVVVDDGSADDTAQVAAATGRAHVISRTRGGRCSARNAGAAAASGHYLLFLDDDDTLNPAGVEALLTAVSNGTAAALIRLAVDHHDADGTHHVVRPRRGAIDVGPYIPGSFAVSAATFAAIGGYDHTIHYAENTELFLRIDARADASDAVIDHVGVHHHHRPDVASHYRADRMAATERILDRHQHSLRDRPALLADLLGVAAHDHFRVGARGQATRFAWRSLRTRPSARRAVRLLRTILVPPALARRGA